MKKFFIILFLSPFICLAQVNISGKVINAGDNKPVADASIFLNNATGGTKSGNDGTFVLYNARPGQYELIVSVVGFETYRKTFLVSNQNITLADIKISPKTTQLKEVKVQPPSVREANVLAVEREVLGNSEAAIQCKILNPDILDVDYDKDTRILTASTDDFLEIENRALGYKIKYLLNEFKKDDKAGLIYLKGTALYEEMQGSPAQKRRWAKKRIEAYEGSSMHFLRSVIHDSVDVNGFKVYQFISKENPAYTTGGKENKYLQNLVIKPLNTANFIKQTDQKGLYIMSYKDLLYVLYTKKHERPKPWIYHPAGIPDCPITILTLNTKYIYFDNNGIVINPESIVYEGSWGNNRIAELLPVNYEPVIVK